MKTTYLDSSAFVKLVAEEAETDALRVYLTAHPGRRVSSTLLRTEAVRAVRHHGSEALATAREGIRRLDLIAIDDRILEVAGILEPRVLRTLDAIHLATAMALGADLDVVVTYDDRMAEGAALLGLATATPR